MLSRPLLAWDLPALAVGLLGVVGTSPQQLQRAAGLIALARLAQILVEPPACATAMQDDQVSPRFRHAAVLYPARFFFVSRLWVEWEYLGGVMVFTPPCLTAETALVVPPSRRPPRRCWR
jgi:hypothetical protein